ncbi:DUF6264 family protein [Leifsonia sp. NPDC080035]|uniref:DUF6264 family protein n=1 Tax=Leifsonia sp. NPDC080035 TaxID=3143936 RepID=A0AAU7GBH8_9MICO
MAEDDKSRDGQGDERPRPQFGELAPPGWSWHPPQDADRLDTARHSPAASEPEPVAPPPPYDRPVPPQLRAAGPRWNLTFTILLLVGGFFGMTYSIGTLQALPAAMELLHSTQHLVPFTADPSVGSLITGGSIAMAAIWAVSLGVTIWLLVQKRLSFYVPLIAGVVALITLFVIVGIVLATDPVLLDFYSGVGPATPVPTAPSTPPATTT